MLESGKSMAYIYLSFAMVIVGSSMVFGKVITQAFPVFLASGLRFAIASVLMLPIIFITEKNLFKISGKDCLQLVLMAFCGQFVFTVLLLLGLRYTSGIEAGIITSTTPAMMVGVAFILFREKPGFWQLLALGAVVMGVACLNMGDSFNFTAVETTNLAGNLMVLGAVFGEAFFLLMRKKISKDVSNPALAAYLCLAGAILFFPFSLFQALSFDFSSVPVRAWAALGYFGAVFTVLAYLFWFKGVSRVSGSTAGMFTAIMPVSSVVFSCLFLDEVFTLSHGIGVFLVLAAILLLSLNP